MYVRNNLSSYLIFSASDDVLNTNRLLSMPSDDELSWGPLHISQDTLSSSLSRLSSINFSSVNTASTALTMTSFVGSYLSDAKSIIEELKSIAEQASSSSLSTEDRVQLSEDSAGLMDRLTYLYTDASYRDEPLMQGGTKTFVIGPGDAEAEINFGNLDTGYLGLASIDLSSAESSQAAYEAISGALTNVEDQINVNAADYQNVRSYTDMTSDDDENPYRAEVINTIFQNSLSAISTKMTYALNIQAYDLRTNSINTMLSQFQKLSRSISAADIIEEREAEAEESSSSSSSTTSASTGTTPSENKETGSA